MRRRYTEARLHNQRGNSPLRTALLSLYEVINERVDKSQQFMSPLEHETNNVYWSLIATQLVNIVNTRVQRIR